MWWTAYMSIYTKQKNLVFQNGYSRGMVFIIITWFQFYEPNMGLPNKTENWLHAVVTMLMFRVACLGIREQLITSNRELSIRISAKYESGWTISINMSLCHGRGQYRIFFLSFFLNFYCHQRLTSQCYVEEEVSVNHI